MKVVNIFGGPCSGKSTVAAGVFNKLKEQGVNVELVTEYPKDLVWSERKNMFSEQDYIFAKQNHRLRRLRGKVDYAISDGPLLMMLAYIPDDYPKSFAPFVIDMFKSYNNINYFLNRTHPYEELGRNQTEEQAEVLSHQIKDHLNQHSHYLTLDTKTAVEYIIHQALSW